MNPELNEINGIPSRTSMTQGPGFFGVRDTDTKIYGNFPNVEVGSLEFDQTEGSDLQWPTDGSVRVERLIFMLESGCYGLTNQAFTNILSDTSEIATSIGFDRSSRGGSLIAVLLRDPNDESFPFKKRSLESGVVGKESVMRKNIYFYEMAGYKGNGLARVVAIAEAHQIVWRKYRLPLNKFIKNGEFARRGVVGENNPYQIIQELAKIEKPGEYLVRDILGLEGGWDSNVFEGLIKMATQIKFSDSRESIFNYAFTEEGSIVISDRHLREFQVLQDAGYYDNEQNCQIILAKKENLPDGNFNRKGVIAKVMAELQDKYSLTIPVSELEKGVRSKYGEHFAKIGSPRFRELIYEVLIRKGIGPVGELVGDNIVLSKKIVVLEDVPLQSYGFLSGENKQLHQALLFRKRLIEKWLSKDGNVMKISYSEAREVYRKMIEELGGIVPSNSGLTWKVRNFEYSFESIPSIGPRIILSEFQLKRIKEIAKILSDVPKRYEYLSRTNEGQEYIRELFGKDLDETGDRIGATAIPEVRLVLIRTLLEELKDFFDSIDKKVIESGK